MSMRGKSRRDVSSQRLSNVVSLGLIAALTVSACAVSACGSSERGAINDASAVDQSKREHYEFGPASRDGIGKFYMGREISHVMGHLGAGWLERPDRQREERTDLLVDNLPLTESSTVADIGAGTGYFSFRIAERVPGGEVLAVDIQQEMLDIIESRKAGGAPNNVKTILGSERDPRLPEAAVDVILMVDAYHEFSYPREMGQAMAKALRPGGYLVLIEYRGEDPAVAIKPLHKMTAAQAIAEMQAIGLEWERTEDVLPQQHFLVFRRPVASKGSP
jgi:SAM-dependent methyltransferase